MTAAALAAKILVSVGIYNLCDFVIFWLNH